MSKPLKITVIGAGSTYTPELMNGILEYRNSLDVRQISLMDIDERKLSIVGGLCARMIKAAGLDCEVTLTESLDEALTGADFVVAQIRVGKLPARVLDEKIPVKHGLIGQETTGIGGFFKALRTIPALLEIAGRMEQLCPNAFLINFSNPSGIVTQALLDHSKVKAVGLCNVPINMIDDLYKKLGIDHGEITYVGLNHLSWITSVSSDGVDYTQKAIDENMTTKPMNNINASGFSAELVRLAQGIPSSYLEYFYHRDHKLKLGRESEKTRGEICMEIEAELLEIYRNLEVSSKPVQLEKRGGSKYSLAAISLLNAIANDKNEIHVVNTHNRGCLPFMADTDVVEVACMVNAQGVTPIPVKSFYNQHIETLMKQVKSYELYTVQAAVTGSDDEAMRALLVNPLVLDYSAASACYHEMKEAHKPYLQRFFEGETA